MVYQPTKKRKRNNDQPDRDDEIPASGHLPAYQGKNSTVARLIEAVQDNFNKELRTYITLQHTKYKTQKQIAQLGKGLDKRAFSIKVTLQPYKDMEANKGELQRQAQEALEARAAELQAAYKAQLEEHLHHLAARQVKFLDELLRSTQERLQKIHTAVQEPKAKDNGMDDNESPDPIVVEAMTSITEGLLAFKMRQAAKTLDLQDADQKKAAEQEKRKTQAQEAMKEVEPMRKSIENYIDKRIKAKTKSDRKSPNKKADKDQNKNKTKTNKQNKRKDKNKNKKGKSKRNPAKRKGPGKRASHKNKPSRGGQGNGFGKRERQRR